MRSLIAFLGLVLVPPLAAETLSVAKLARNESIIIVYSREDGPHYVERLYEIKLKGPVTAFGAVERKTSVKGKTINPEPNRTIGEAELTTEEKIGLDAYLLYLRHARSGKCATIDLFTIGYYRDDKKIGEERFRDETCRTAGFRRVGEHVEPDEKSMLRDFPPALFNAIVPPRLIEERIAEEAAATPAP